MPSQEAHGKGIDLVRKIFVLNKVTVKAGFEASYRLYKVLLDWLRS